MIKTSLTHPLQIAEVSPDGLSGTIGLTLCPGRGGESLAGGSWRRDLAADLDAVRAWDPALVLGLLEDHEYAMLEIPHFKRDVTAAGLPWLFAEIRDGGVPDERFEAAWRSIGHRARSYLRDGRRVLIHCRAGLGRTGLVAAMLFVELGADPEAAIERVRAARPGAVETAEQEAYVRSRRVANDAGA